MGIKRRKMHGNILLPMSTTGHLLKNVWVSNFEKGPSESIYVDSDVVHIVYPVPFAGKFRVTSSRVHFEP